MADSVFISYARDSGTASATALLASLRRAGVTAFLDTGSLDHGDSIPDRLFDALLDTRVLVAFADATYFTRRYCVEELATALAAYRTLAGSPEAERREALLPIVIVLGQDGQRDPSLERLPPELRATKWPGIEETPALSRLIQERLASVTSTFGERLDRLGERAQIRNRLRETMAVPPPRALGTVPLYHETGLPPSIGDAFVGRSRELWELHTTLASHHSGAAALTAAVAGGGGFGKTRLVLEYLHRYGPGTYPGGLLWLEADVPSDRLASQFHGMLRVLRPETPDLRTFHELGRDAARELAEALRERATAARILYVVDNLPEPEGDRPPDDLSRFCPAVGAVSLLVTSRARQLVPAGLLHLEVRELPEESAVRLLTIGVRERHLLRDETWREIAAWVGCLPLALELLNAMLRVGAIGPAELLAAQRGGAGPAQQVDRAMEALRGLVPSGTLRGVTEALRISYERLPEDARHAAHVLARLSPAPVPARLVSDDTLFPPRVKALLRARSFVTEVSSGEVELYGRMHRLVAGFLHDWGGDEEHELAEACGILSAIMELGAWPAPDGWALVHACRPHADALLDRALPLGTAVPAGRCSLLLGMALGMLLSYSWQPSLDLARRCLAVARSGLPPEHPVTLVATLLVGDALRARGRLAQARETLEPLVGPMTRELGQEAEATVVTRMLLAATVRAQGELQYARELLADLVETCERTLGETHHHTLFVLGLLGRVLHDQGDFPQARETLERAVERNRRTRGEQDPRTLELTAILGMTAYQLGDRAGVRELQGRVVSVSARVLGPGHQVTLLASSYLATILHEDGDFDGAVDLLERTIEASRPVLGDEHWWTLSSRLDLARSIAARGERARAIELAEHVSDAARRVLGEGSDLAARASHVLQELRAVPPA